MPPPPSLQGTRDNQHRHVRRQRAQHRTRDEQAERDDDHGTAAVNVAERAEHRRYRGRGQQIGRDHPGEIGDVVKLAADGRQCGRDDGLVEGGQKHRQHQADQDGADFAPRQRCRAAQASGESRTSTTSQRHATEAPSTSASGNVSRRKRRGSRVRTCSYQLLINVMRRGGAGNLRRRYI